MSYGDSELLSVTVVNHVVAQDYVEGSLGEAIAKSITHFGTDL